MADKLVNVTVPSDEEYPVERTLVETPFLAASTRSFSEENSSTVAPEIGFPTLSLIDSSKDVGGNGLGFDFFEHDAIAIMQMVGNNSFLNIE